MSVMVRLLGYLRPFKGQVAVATGLSGAAIASNIGLLVIAGYLLARTATGQSLVLLTLPIYAVRLLAVTRAGARYLERLAAHNVTFHILARVRLQVYDRLAALGPLLPLGLHSGDSMRRFVRDVDELQNLYLRAVSPLAVALLIAGLAAAVLQAVTWTLTLTVMAYLTVSGLVLPALSMRLAHGLAERESALGAALTTRLVDGIGGLCDLLLFGATRDLLAQVSRLDAEMAEANRRRVRIEALRLSGGDLAASAAIWTSLVILIPLIAAGTTARDWLPVTSFLVLGAFEATQQLGAAFDSLGAVQAAGGRVFAAAGRKPTVTSPPHPLALPSAPDLRFIGVTLSYGSDVPPVLEDVSFTLRRGCRIAVVGPSGAGKTSLIRLAVRMLDPSAGAVILGGSDLRLCKLEDARARFAIAGHDPYIFYDTIRGNLLIARPAARDVELWDALARAGLGHPVRALPLGLDTWLGEDGTSLSAGERQRLSIARAFLKDAPILLLDEPTANLDRLTENAVLDAIETISDGRSVLLATHRLVHMERWDEILVLDGGRIVERGTHEDLMRRQGRYRAMVDLQEALLATR
jgi:ATP-binding cassette subfamily C protein CydC